MLEERMHTPSRMHVRITDKTSKRPASTSMAENACRHAQITTCNWTNTGHGKQQYEHASIRNESYRAMLKNTLQRGQRRASEQLHKANMAMAHGTKTSLHLYSRTRLRPHWLPTGRRDRPWTCTTRTWRKSPFPELLPQTARNQRQKRHRIAPRRRG